MFKIEEYKIHLTRGDKGTINLSIEDYTFKVKDKVEFRIYKKSGLSQLPVFKKEVTVEKETDNVDISFTKEDTKLGEAGNKPVTYWYEIELNDEQTVIGYDEDGAKELILYPEGVEANDTMQ